MGRHLVGQVTPKEESAGRTGRKKERKKDEKPALAAEQSLTEKLSRPVSSLKLKGLYHNTARVCIFQLGKRGVLMLGDLVKLKEEDLLQMRYARGEKFRKALMKELRSLGLSLGMPKESRKRKETKEDLARKEMVSKLVKSVDELELSVRAANCLQNANIRFIAQLVVKTDVDMLKIKNLGRRTLRELKVAIAELNFAFGTKLDEKTLAEVKAKTRDMDERLRLLSTSLKELGLPTKVGISLWEEGITTLSELVQKTREELLSINGVGSSSVRKVENRLEELGFSLGMKLDDATLAGLRARIPAKELAIANQDRAPAKENLAQALETPVVRGLPLMYGTAIMVNQPMEEFMALVENGSAELNELRKLVRPQNVESLGKLLDFFRMLPFAEAAASHSGFVGMGVVGEGGRQLVYGTAVMVARPVEEFQGLLEKGQEELKGLKRLVQPQAMESLGKLLDFFSSPSNEEAKKAFESFVGENKKGVKPN